jgi:hypothetical protein
MAAERKTVAALGDSLLRDKGRIYDLVQIWLAGARGDDLDTLVEGALDVFLNKRVALGMTLNGITLFEDSHFMVPLRHLKRNELAALHALLKAHRKGPIFKRSVDMQSFSLEYTDFRYDAILGQHVDRIAFARALAEICLGLTWGADRGRLRGVFAKYFAEAARRFTPHRHPCQRALQGLSRAYKK